MKNKLMNYTVEGIIFASICVFCLLSFAVTKSMAVTEDKIQENYTYVSYEVLTDNIIPVVKTESEIAVFDFKSFIESIK